MGKLYAVVVTYNRPELLQRTIAAILAQTRLPDHILVIDNASDRPARDFLPHSPRIEVVRLYTNGGGAGGFYHGLKQAFKEGADAVWMMDDDGVPDSRSLELLTKELHGQAVIGHPLVVNIDAPEKLAFEQNVNSTWLRTVADAQRYASGTLLHDVASPFNGTLVPRSVYEKIGNIKRECFIWGDEMEYIARARAASIPLITVTNSLHYHPADKRATVIYPFVGGVLTPTPKFSNILYRNLGFIWWRHDKSRFALKGLVYFMHIFFTVSPAAGWEFIKYYFDGARDRYKLTPSRTDLTQR